MDSSGVVDMITSTMDTIITALTQNVNVICISFNGGKDSMVALMLTRMCCNAYHLPLPPCVWFQTPSTFPQITDFVHKVSSQYGLTLIIIPTPTIREGLEQLAVEMPDLTTMIIGTRRTDPAGVELELYSPTSPGWPSMMRFHPILDWSYTQVWDFIDTYDVPYCSLYDSGYTSIGGSHNTQPNTHLRIEGGYRPARELLDGSKERAGRR